MRKLKRNKKTDVDLFIHVPFTEYLLMTNACMCIYITVAGAKRIRLTNIYIASQILFLE